MKKLYEVVNFDTREVHKIFASSERSALKMCRCLNDDCQVEELLGYNREGKYSIYLLKDIPYSSFFRYVSCNSFKIGNRTYIKQKHDYDKSIKKYVCMDYEDISRSREFKPTQWVVTDFTY